MGQVLKHMASLSSRPGTAHAMEALYLFVALLIPFVIAALLVRDISVTVDPGPATVAKVLAAVVTAAAALALFSTLADLSGQRARDLFAQSLFADLKAGRKPARPFTIYLRPFAATNVIEDEVIDAAMSAALRGPLVFTSTRFELEQQIERAARRFGQLVGLGQPLEHVGAGRILVGDDEWQDAVKLLSDNAALIILLPSSRPGTLWEVDRILSSDLIERTVIVDPPNLPKVASALYDQGQEWAQVRKAFEEKGYAIPEDSRAGQLIWFGRSRAPVAQAKLDIDAHDNIARFFRQVLRGRQKLRDGETPA